MNGQDDNGMPEFDDDVFANDLDNQNNQQQPQAPVQQPVMIPLDQAMQMMQRAQPPVQQVQAPAPQMTDAERAAHLRQFTPDEQFANAFVDALTPDSNTGQINPAKVRQVLETMVQSQRAEQLRALELHAQLQEQQFNQQFAPVQQFVTHQQREATWDSFAGAYPQLGNMRQLVEAKATELAPMFPPGTTQQQAFQYVANAVAADCQRMGIPLPAVNQQNRRPQQPSPNQQFPGLQPVTVPSMTQMPQGLGGAPRQQRSGPSNPYFDDSTWGKR